MTNYNLKEYRKVRTPLFTWASALVLKCIRVWDQVKETQQTSLIGVCGVKYMKIGHVHITSFQQVVV